MSDRHICKAKRTDNGEWVEGFYVMYSTSIGHPYSYTDGKHYIQTVPHNIQYEVDPSTLCQCTGLTDKNGKKIWENDIVEISKENGYFKLEWEEDTARWIMNNEDERFIVHFDNYWAYEVEVIGNIFDNLELLKGGAE